MDIAQTIPLADSFGMHGDDIGAGRFLVLERRFAEGEISIEEYRARREVLVNGSADPTRAHDQEPMTAHPAGGGGHAPR